MNHWYHQDMGYHSIVNMLMMCGTVGVSGGGFAHYVGQERLGDLQGHCAPLTLLREPERFASIAAEVSNCPSGQQGGNLARLRLRPTRHVAAHTKLDTFAPSLATQAELGQTGYGDTVPEFEKVLFCQGRPGYWLSWLEPVMGFMLFQLISAFWVKSCRSTSYETILPNA